MRRNRVVKIISTLIMLFFLANAVYALLLWGRSTGIARSDFQSADVRLLRRDRLLHVRVALSARPRRQPVPHAPTRSRPAPLLSPVEALIRQTRYGEALERLNLLIEAGPEFPTAWLMRFDLLRGPLHSPEEAMRTAERYFVRPDRLRSDDNAKLALRYAELARELGRQDEAIRFLTAELRRRGTRCSRAERALPANMLEALKKNDLRRMHLE